MHELEAREGARRRKRGTDRLAEERVRLYADTI